MLSIILKPFQKNVSGLKVEWVNLNGWMSIKHVLQRGRWNSRVFRPSRWDPARERGSRSRLALMRGHVAFTWLSRLLLWYEGVYKEKMVFPQEVRPKHKSSGKEWHAEGTVRLLYSRGAQSVCPADHSLWIVINTWKEPLSQGYFVNRSVDVYNIYEYSGF